MPVANPHSESYRVKKVTYPNSSTIKLELKDPNTAGDNPLELLYLVKVSSGASRSGSEDPEDGVGNVILTQNSSNSDFNNAKNQIAVNDTVSYLSTRLNNVEQISQFTWS